MTDTDAAKEVVGAFIQAVWRDGDLDALARFWTEDCQNHAAPPGAREGLTALRAYHESFAPMLSALAPLRIDIVQQIAERDRVVTHLVASGRHGGDLPGLPATGRAVSMATIRIDRIADGRIAEHWSVADMAGLMAQLQA